MRYRCNLCGTFPAGTVFESDRGQCPKCGAEGEPWVARLTDVHLVVVDPKGPIQGGGVRLRVACQPKRQYLALNDGVPYSASGDARAVTCPSCRGTPAWREQARLYAELEGAVELGGPAPVDSGPRSGG